MPPNGSAPAHPPWTQFEHYVPQVYHKPFVVEGQGRDSIYHYDKVSVAPRLKNIAKVDGARNFYKVEGVIYVLEVASYHSYYF